MKHAIANGKVVAESKVQIPLTSRAFFYGFAVYSSIKIVNGKPFFGPYHAARLFDSAKQIGLAHNFKKADILGSVAALVKADKVKNDIFKIVLVGASAPDENAKLFVFSTGVDTAYPPDFYKRGVKVITYRGERRLPRAKTLDLLISYLASREAAKKDALDALLIDRDGNVREGTRTNVFAIKGQTLLTPPAEKTLEGITKKIILKAAAKEFKIKETDIPATKLKTFDEIFISSTSMGVMPVRQIDALKIRSNFARTHRIAELFDDALRAASKN
ncbi:MAG: aminotransferase class IV [Alphaproteobacteria bacterium]|nr:aminotransferase class IV [Alphaproteobacteria bacterium]